MMGPCLFACVYMSPLGRIGSEVMDHVEGLVSRLLEAEGLSDQAAARVAGVVVDRLADDFGGQLVYLSKMTGKRAQNRNARLVAEFDGANQSQLARAYGLSVSQVYRVLKAAGKAHGKSDLSPQGKS